MSFKKVALVHDWLFHMRGGEKVLEAIAELFPEAEIFTLFLEKDRLSPSLQSHTIQPSFLNSLPHSRRIYQWLLPILPWTIEQFDLRDFDLVISSSHCVAKGVKVPAGIPHVCYCHTPMRYAWYFEEEYFSSHTFPIQQIIRLFLKGLRKWDLKNSQGVSKFVANSKNVAEKIKDLYGKEAKVIYPPLEMAGFVSSPKKKDYYLVVSALVPYKKVELAVQACNELTRNLWIVGTGGEEAELRKIAGPTIHFTGWASDNALKEIYASAKALLFPGEEDFGIVPLEAQAAGVPVIAYGKGGALETVRGGETGIFFYEQSAEVLKKAILDFEKMHFDAAKLHKYVESFSKERFKKEFLELIRSL